MTDTELALTDALFEPIAIDGMTVPNRIAMAPMTREFAPGGVPGADVAAYYARRAAGGVGLVITEGMAVNAEGAHDGPIPRLFLPEARAGLAAIADAVHRAGGKVIPQLWHVGIQDSPTEINPETVKKRPRRLGPSGLNGAGACAGDVLDERGIADTIGAFADAARIAESIGYDGIEIHGAHGYLPDQFLWSRTNRREDRYGADRTRFVVELLRACRAAVSPGFPIILRLSQWKSFDYAARLAETPAELEALLRPIVDAGAAALHCSTRRFREPGFAGSALTLAGWMRRISGLPVIAVGSVTLEADFKDGKTEATGGIADSALRSRDVADVARLIAAGEFDMIAVGRALIANPDWAALVREGRQAELRPFTKDLLATLS